MFYMFPSLRYSHKIRKYNQKVSFPQKKRQVIPIFSLFFFLLICNRAFANVSLVREDLMLLVFGGMVQLIHHVSLGNTKVWMISFCYYCKEMVGKYLLC